MSTKPHPCSCIICLGKESMLCVCGCSSGNYCLLRGWISTCPGLCTVRVSNQNTNWYSIKQLSQHTELLTTSTSYEWTLTQGFCVEKILPLEDKFVWLHYIQKGNSSNIHNVIKYFTIRLSGDNTATQVCTLCFVLKNIQNFVDLDATSLCGFTTFRKGIAQTYTMS